MRDLLEFAYSDFMKNFDCSNYCDGFIRFQKYGRSDVFRILGASENPVPQNVGGYLIDQVEKSWCPIFVTYQKHDNFSATTRYEDEFINQDTLKWFTKSNRNIASPDVEFFRSATPAQLIPLFVKKNNDEGVDFYFIGNARPTPDSFKQETMPNGQGGSVSVVTMIMKLDKPITDNIYNYLTS